jgi:hypothetical protein
MMKVSQNKMSMSEPTKNEILHMFEHYLDSYELLEMKGTNEVENISDGFMLNQVLTGITSLTFKFNKKRPSKFTLDK